MAIGIEIVTAVIILAYVVFGAKLGFARSFISSFGTLISLILAISLCPLVAEFTQSSFSFVETISDGIKGTVTSLLGDTVANTPIALATEDFLRRQGLAGWLASIVIDVKSGGIYPITVTVADVISPVFGYYIVCLIAVVVLFILFKILFAILSRMLTKLHKVPVLGKADIILGAVLGIIKGMFAVQIIILIVGIIPVGFFQDIIIAIPSTYLTKFIDSINLFDIILKAIAETRLLDIIIGIVR